VIHEGVTGVLLKKQGSRAKAIIMDVQRQTDA
jgi:hypothetical protein